MAIPGSCIQKIVLLEGPLFGFKWLPSKRSLIAIAIGQFLSLLLTCTGVTSQLLAVNYNVNAPTTQSLLNYLLLCAYTAPLIYQGLFWPALRARWWRYLILAFLDVEANYFVVKAYQYTNLTRFAKTASTSSPPSLILTLFVQYHVARLFYDPFCDGPFVLLDAPAFFQDSTLCCPCVHRWPRDLGHL